MLKIHSFMPSVCVCVCVCACQCACMRVYVCVCMCAINCSAPCADIGPYAYGLSCMHMGQCYVLYAYACMGVPYEYTCVIIHYYILHALQAYTKLITIN